MTTRSQIKELAAPLLARHADLALVKDTIVIRPVGHLLNFILIERTGNADVFDPHWGSALLFSRRTSIPIGEAMRLYYPTLRQIWRWSEPTLVDVFTDAVEYLVLPKLRAVRTLEDYFRLVPAHDPEEPVGAWHKFLMCSLALGWLDRTKSLLEQNPHVLGNEWGVQFARRLDEYSSGLGTRLLELGGRLARDDRMKLAEYLHENEAFSVKNLGLQKIWTRTEFPIESLNV